MDLNQKYSIVLVIKEFTHITQDGFSNLDRFIRIGMKSYEKYLDLSSLYEFIVITPRTDFKKISDTLQREHPAFPWRFIVEEAIVSKNIPDGWAKQQTAKLAIAPLIKTNHYLIIDDDTYLTKMFSFENMFYEGKLIMNKTQIDFPFFFLWSAQIAQVDYDIVQNAPYHMAITPEIFHTETVKEIVRWLQVEYGEAMKWQEYLAEHKYTEYCLYWTYLLKLKKCNVLYTDSIAAPQVYGYATSGQEHDLVQQVAQSFTKNDKHFFSFVQSSLPYKVDQVEAIVTQYL